MGKPKEDAKITCNKQKYDNLILCCLETDSKGSVCAYSILYSFGPTLEIMFSVLIWLDFYCQVFSCHSTFFWRVIVLTTI